MQANPLRRLVVALGAAVVLAGAAIVFSATAGSTTKPAKPTAVPELFRGIPERDGVLGGPGAPVTVTEFVDLQCPVCAQASEALLPILIDEYVRPGKVKLVAETMHFIGPDSERAARVAAGAAEQGRLWAFLHAFYTAQGAENSGYVTDDFLREVSRAAGVDADAAMDAADSDGATAALRSANEHAATYGVNATPTFMLGHGDTPSHSLGSGLLDADELRAALDKALGR